MSSTIAAARTALNAALNAHAWPAPAPQVTFGLPVEHEEQEVVALTGIEEPDEDDAAIGGQRSEEAYIVVVAFKAYDPAGAAATVDARGFEIADHIRRAVLADRTLGGVVRDARPTSTTSEGAQLAAGGGWVIFGEVRVRCRARIT